MRIKVSFSNLFILYLNLAMYGILSLFINIYVYIFIFIGLDFLKIKVACLTEFKTLVNYNNNYVHSNHFALFFWSN